MVDMLKKRLGDILLEERLLMPEQLSQALYEQRRTGQPLAVMISHLRLSRKCLKVLREGII